MRRARKDGIRVPSPARLARGWKRTAAICLAGMALACTSIAANPLLSQPAPVAAKADNGPKGRETGLKVPRFVSLRSREARMRVGPSLDYGIAWIYRVPGLPLEITAEYGNWRQVRDSDGVSGWMHRALLSSNRTAIVGPWLSAHVPLRDGPSSSARKLASLTPRVRVAISDCDGSWCKVDVTGHDLDGFIRQSALWGVYPNETIK
ncbi:SH3 domain-containing protein [Rhizobium sp. 2MFCol3.1]|uniref:SH3 domain-containing protein n=1 Tax=Rhizobium sp. 2MFCol3.1 TaxID=1246459 RepID=UPI000368F94E|nr:SH3 domain-containing protein [Rhizobium sp. 2MFCol3.1]